MNYIVDGYNLAFKIENNSQKLTGGETDLVIKQVAHFVKSGIKDNRSKIIIVFDGRENNQPHKLQYGGVTLLFSKKPQTADDIIRNFIRKSKNVNNWTVVSSDNEILFTARDHGAKTMRSQNFIRKRNQLLQKEQNSSAEINKRNPQNIDVEYWSDIFNSGKNS